MHHSDNPRPFGAGPIAFVSRAVAASLPLSMLRALTEAGVACRDVGRRATLTAPTAWIVNPIDFRDTARLIDKGYRLAADWLASTTTQTTRAATGPVTSPLDDARRRRQLRS